MKSGSHPIIQSAWLDQPGRVPSGMTSHADGFQGSGAIASVVAVGDGPPCEKEAVEKAVSVIRDAFAEGVAYGAGDVLEDTIAELSTDHALGKISLAAAVGLGDEAWIYVSGDCVAFKVPPVGDEEHDSALNTSGKAVVRHLPMKPGEAVVLVTKGLRRLAGSRTAMEYCCDASGTLNVKLAGMVEATRIRFRKEGCSAACLRAARASRLKRVLSRRRIIYTILVLLLLALAALGLCGDRDINGSGSGGSRNGFSDSSEVVMPL
jgi:hypothetical protein